MLSLANEIGRPSRKVRGLVILVVLLVAERARADVAIAGFVVPQLYAPPPAATASYSGAAPVGSRRRRLEWDERWHRFRPVEYASTAVTGIAGIGVFWFATPSDHPKWTTPLPFDTPVRNLLRLHTRSGLEAAQTSSSILAYTPGVQALIDSVIVPAARGNFDVMWQLGMMDAQAFALSGLVVSSLYDTTGRARPSYNDCKTGNSVDPYCNAGTFASFPSGHTAVAMTGAGLTCAHHGALPLYGSPAMDGGACAVGITVSAAVGVLRLMADRHYASDVLIGGAIGFFSGYGLPRLLHYWKRPIGELVVRDDLHVAILPGNASTPIGLRLTGEF